MGGPTHRTLDAFFFHKVGAGCRATALGYLRIVRRVRRCVRPGAG
jgi:hypothetical protein